MRSPFVSAFVLGLGAMALGVQGCAQKANHDEPLEHTVRKVPAETPVATPEAEPESVPGGVSEAKQEFEHSLHQKLEALDAEIRDLQRKVANLEESAKAEWAEKMAALHATRDAAASKLEEIRKSTGEAWEHLRDGAREARDKLEQAVKEAIKDF